MLIELSKLVLFVKNMSGYVLSTNEFARKRLEIQHNLYLDSSLELLGKANIKEGMKCLEIGCGSGDMTCEIAALIGEEGKLFAIDVSEEQVKASKTKARDFHNIFFKTMGLEDIDEIGERFDFIYCRMVLHHLNNPSDAIRKMVACLNDNGILVCEEPPLLEGTFSYPFSPALEELEKLVHACFEANHKDWRIGYRLAEEMQNCGLSIQNESLFQPMLSTMEQKMLYIMGMNDIRPQLMQTNLVSETEFELLKQKLMELVTSVNSITWLRMHQCVGVKT